MTVAAGKAPEVQVTPEAGPVSLVRGLGVLWPYVRTDRAQLVLAVALSLLGAALALAQPLLVGRVIQAAGAGEGVALLVTVAVAAVLAGAAASALEGFVLERAGEGVVFEVRRSLASRLLHLRLAEHDRRPSGDLLSRSVSDTAALRTVVTSGLVTVIGTVLTAAGALVLMGLIDWVLLVVTVVAVLVGVTSGVAASSRLASLELVNQRALGTMTSAMSRALGALRTIRASGATERELDTIVVSAEAARVAGVRTAALSAVIAPITTVAMQGAFVAVLGVGGYRVASGTISVAHLVAFILLLFTLIQPVGQVLSTWGVLQSGLAALTRIQEVMDLPTEEETSEGAVVIGGSDMMSSQQSFQVLSQRYVAPALEFAGVHFSYDDEMPILQNVSFCVQRGTRTALVGPSGAGKSTVLALIARFYDPTSGLVRLNGVDSRALRRDAVRARLGYVEQDAPVLDGTLRQNLLLAAPQAGNDQVEQVLGAVGLTALGNRSLQGLDAVVGEAGTLLSGGERQRLAIARSLLAQPELLLLDEPTASLDARSEALLRTALDAVSQRCTVVMVAHRLSTVVDADQIIVMEEGRITATGRHRELLESSPLYRELASTQLLC